MIRFDLVEEAKIDEGLAALRAWQARPDAAIWYTTAWAAGQRPGDGNPSSPGGCAS